ncbi:MAG: hypothetical protein HY243_14995 [Proteobacteria bacterium]|nr:hypothetical protein [Pseudomonadota bacterium]
MSLDWTKPIRFANGERCRLIETWSGGTPNFPDKKRIIERLDQDTSTLGGAISATWWIDEVGTVSWPDMQIVNEDCELSDEEAAFLARANIDQSPLYPKK